MKKPKKTSSYSLMTTSFSLFISFLPLLTVAKTCDVTTEGTTFNPYDKEYDECDIFVLDSSFQPMIDGRDETSNLQTLLTATENIFHEGPVLFDDALYFTTNRLGDTGDPVWLGTPDELALGQYIDIMKLDLATNTYSSLTESIFPKIPMANGMTKTADGKNILAISQGFNTTGGGIFEINRESLDSKPILSSFYGQSFNSPNDIEITKDGIIFFNDPPYGFEQGFRAGKPQLGSNLYRYNTNTKRQTLLVANLQRPNGIALLDDRENGNGCKLFLSDSGFEVGYQTQRGFQGFGDSVLYTMEDDSDGCFAPEDGPWILEPLIPVGAGGIQDGMQVHMSSKTLLYCDNAHGLWIYSIPLRTNIGLVKQKCTQAIFPQQDGLQTVYILCEKELKTVGLNFISSGSSNNRGLNFISSGSLNNRGKCCMIIACFVILNLFLFAF